MAACPPCNEANLPQCGDPLRLICLQNANDTAPIAAWFEPVCVEGEVVSFDFFADEAGTVPLVGYTMADRVPCPAGLRGINCDAPVHIDLCPPTMDPLIAGLEAIEAQVLASGNQITAQVDASGDQITAAVAAVETAVEAQTPLLQSYDDVGAVLPPNFYDLPQVLAYNGDDNVETITVTDGVDTWVKTFTYTGLLVTGISGWVEQP